MSFRCGGRISTHRHVKQGLRWGVPTAITSFGRKYPESNGGRPGAMGNVVPHAAPWVDPFAALRGSPLPSTLNHCRMTTRTDLADWWNVVWREPWLSRL